jgi:actin-related protein
MDEVPRFSEYRFNKSSDSWLKDEQYLKDWAQKMALTYYRFYACGQILEEEKREREALLADDIKHFQDLIDFNTGLMKDELEEDYPDFQRIKAYAEECHDYQCNIIGIQEYKLTFEELGRLTQEDIDAKLTLQNVHHRYI